MIAFAGREGAETVVVRITRHSTRTIECEARTVPRTDSAHPHFCAMRLTLHHFLNVLRPPVMQTPPFRTAFAAFEIEMLHHYYVSTRLDRNVKDEGRRLFGDVVVDALGSSPQSRHPFGPVPLSIADSTECAFQRVFF